MLTYLIDDDPISLYVAEHVLRTEDFTADIQLFTTAEEALSFLLAHLPTQLPKVIILDLNMPLMDGWEFLQALEPYASTLLGCCHIYILTSSLTRADTARAQDNPLVSGVLYKPLEAKEIRAIKAQLLQTIREELQD